MEFSKSTNPSNPSPAYTTEVTFYWILLPPSKSKVTLFLKHPLPYILGNWQIFEITEKFQFSNNVSSSEPLSIEEKSLCG